VNTTSPPIRVPVPGPIPAPLPSGSFTR